MRLTNAEREVLRRAASRPHGHVCPTPGLRGAVQEVVLRSLERKGLIVPRDNEGCLAPTITQAGRLAVVPDPEKVRDTAIKLATNEGLDWFELSDEQVADFLSRAADNMGDPGGQK